MNYKPAITYKELLEGVKSKVGDIGSLTEAQLQALARKKQELLSLEQRYPYKYYRPYESRITPGRYPQDIFHKSGAKIRLLLGGNRSGKSEAGILEDIWTATGTHPYWRWKTPNHGWIISLDFPTSRDVIESKLRRWLPQEMVKRWCTPDDRTIYLTNGSTIGLRSCDQDIEKFGGSAKHWIHFDEEPRGERGHKIYEECLMRLMDYKGRCWFTLTPVFGMSWTYDELYERAAIDKDIDFVEIATYENPYIDKDWLDATARKLGKEEADIRLYGKYIQLSGLVYKEFQKDVNIIKPFDIPVDWKRYRGIDHGINHPEACVWIALSPQEEIYVYEEYYESGKTIKENCEAIKIITGADKIEWTAIDPSTEARDPQTGLTNRKEYLNNGIVTRAGRTERHAGINYIKQLLNVNPVSGRPTLFIFNTCYNLIKEFQRYRWKSFKGADGGSSDDTVKVMDDALDALRYIIMSKPRFNIFDEEEDYVTSKWYE